MTYSNCEIENITEDGADVPFRRALTGSVAIVDAGVAEIAVEGWVDGVEGERWWADRLMPVLVAEAANGTRFVHASTMDADKAVLERLAKKVRAAGQINVEHWDDRVMPPRYGSAAGRDLEAIEAAFEQMQRDVTWQEALHDAVGRGDWA